MLYKILVFAVWFVILAAVNKFLIGPLWGELAFTALSAGAMVYVLGRIDGGPRSEDA
ncbi:hypothetical protein [Streptomyces sp. Da 82-17]|uniref:hypothetical protein n=1 Tax=Streptomyces sp. Da 82-17 TaxID=3377116 RepID=UPI0038D374E0